MNINYSLNKAISRHKELVLFLLSFMLLIFLFMQTPNKLEQMRGHVCLVSLIGMVGLYRYSLWMMHLVRAFIYEHLVYAGLKKQIAAMQQEDWTPARLYFMMVSHNEDRQTLYESVKSIIYEAQSLDLPATICLGSTTFSDEQVVTDTLRTFPYGKNIKVTFIRQNAPNKRIQIAGALRALIRQGIRLNDTVVFMDSDSIIMPGCLRKCLPLFKLNPKLQALTTNERAVVTNSRLYADILNLRFAQRSLYMNSLALSKKVLCLTGRFSIFKAAQILDEDFLSRIENDYIDDWFWNRIKFISGDDKSSWYSLLEKDAEMLFVPDALVYTVEKASSELWKGYIQDLKRWSGNMLRNNWRALKLGVEKTGIFPWIVLFDQRISMWTALFSPALLLVAFFKDFHLAYALLLWILMVKHVQSLALFWQGRTIKLVYPFVYYVQQILNGLVKVYTLFNLKSQSWNRHIPNKLPMSKSEHFYFAFAKYAAGLSMVIFIMIIGFLIK